MRREPLQDRFSGPFCPDCCDDPKIRAEIECKCESARCAMPKCNALCMFAQFPPVPIGMLLHRTTTSKVNQAMQITPGWVCSPACLFGFMRMRQEGPGSGEQARQAIDAINALQEVYFGLEPGPRADEYRVDRRLYGLISRAQLDTIRQAARYALMASVS